MGERTHTNGSSLAQPTTQPAASVFTHRDFLALGLILLIALLTRIPQLDESLWYDEAFYTSVTLSGRTFARVLFHDVHPPLYPLIIKAWIRLFGEREVTLRLPSLIFGLASLCLTFHLARVWFGRGTAVLAALFIALSPAHIWYSQENKNNMLAVLLAAAVVTLAPAAWRRRCSITTWVAFTALSALALWTHAFLVWVVAAALLWLVIQFARTPQRAAGGWVAASAVGSILAGLLTFIPILSRLQVIPMDYLRPFTPGEAYRLLLVYLAHGNTLPATRSWFRLWEEQGSAAGSSPGLLFSALLLEGFFLLILLAGIRSVFRRPPSPAGDGDSAGFLPRAPAAGRGLLLLWLAVPIAGSLAASLVVEHYYIERSMLILLPPLAILFAGGAMSLGSRWLRRPAVVILLLVSAAGLYSFRVVRAEDCTVYKPNPDWRSAACYLGNEIAGAEEGIVLFATSRATTLLYYDRRAVERGRNPDRPPGKKRIFIYYYRQRDGGRLIGRALSAHRARSFYLVRNIVWARQFEHLLRTAECLPGVRLEEMKTFRHLEIYKFRCATEPTRRNR